jgi:hypothetical protein
VSGLEGELGNRVQVVRLNVDDEVGQRARVVFGAQKVPTIILLNADGSEIYRTEGKLPRTQAIRESLSMAA